MSAKKKLIKRKKERKKERKDQGIVELTDEDISKISAGIDVQRRINDKNEINGCHCHAPCLVG
jgi:hypothetical protein